MSEINNKLKHDNNLPGWALILEDFEWVSTRKLTFHNINHTKTQEVWHQVG